MVLTRTTLGGQRGGGGKTESLTEKGGQETTREKEKNFWGEEHPVQVHLEAKKNPLPDSRETKDQEKLEGKLVFSATPSQQRKERLQTGVGYAR